MLLIASLAVGRAAGRPATAAATAVRLYELRCNRRQAVSSEFHAVIEKAVLEGPALPNQVSEVPGNYACRPPNENIPRKEGLSSFNCQVWLRTGTQQHFLRCTENRLLVGSYCAATDWKNSSIDFFAAPSIIREPTAASIPPS